MALLLSLLTETLRSRPLAPFSLRDPGSRLKLLFLTGTPAVPPDRGQTTASPLTGSAAHRPSWPLNPILVLGTLTLPSSIQVCCPGPCPEGPGFQPQLLKETPALLSKVSLAKRSALNPILLPGPRVYFLPSALSTPSLQGLRAPLSSSPWGQPQPLLPQSSQAGFPSLPGS